MRAIAWNGKPLRTSGNESVCLFSVAGLWRSRQRPKKPATVVALSRLDLNPATTGTCEFGQRECMEFGPSLQGKRGEGVLL